MTKSEQLLNKFKVEESNTSLIYNPRTIQITITPHGKDLEAKFDLSKVIEDAVKMIKSKYPGYKVEEELLEGNKMQLSLIKK